MVHIETWKMVIGILAAFSAGLICGALTYRFVLAQKR